MKQNTIYQAFIIVLTMITFSCNNIGKNPPESEQNDSILAEPSSNLTEPTPSSNRLVGEWQGTDDNDEKLSIIFKNDGNVVFIQGNEVITSNSDYKGFNNSISYELNDSIQPSRLDIVIHVNDEKKGEKYTKRFSGIMRNLSDDKIEWKLFKSDEVDFRFENNDSKNTLVLDRVIK